MTAEKAPSTGLVIAAHGALARALADAAASILRAEPAVEAVSVDDPEAAFAAVTDAVKRADQGAGVLVLADLFGGSAANLALAQLDGRVEVVTGVNLAMVVSAIQHLEEDPGALAARVAEAARGSVVVAGDLLGSRSAA